MNEEWIAKDILHKVDNIFLDCDGVLWRGSHVIPKTVETLEFLRSRQKQLYFITNNSSATRSEYQKKIHDKFGIDVKKDEILTSGFAACLYLKSISFVGKIYVVGSNSLRSELREAGFDVYDVSHDQMEYKEEEMSQTKVDGDIGCVIVGYDNKINNYKLAYATLCLQHPKSLFVATNTDATLPYGGVFLPGTGCIVNSLATSVGRKPIVCGKPEPILFLHLRDVFGIDLKRSIMIGDRLDTDIKMGMDASVMTALVMTGVTQCIDLEHDIQPTYVLSSLSVLLQ
jgi:phosphoglycolate/pyridoxal phosphate phosphatase family enzyme